MKRIAALSLTTALGAGLLFGCGAQTEEVSTPAVEEEPVAIVGTAENLRIVLPYGADEETVEEHGDAFLSALQTALRERGWDVSYLDVTIAATDAASGKALDDGTAELVILPASQYFTYGDDVVLLMTATTPGVSVNTTTAADWNGSVDAVSYTDADCPYSRTLICATSSEMGKALAQKSANGTLTWDDLAAAQWLYAAASSSSDFFYPDLWLSLAFDKTMEELPNTLAMDGYAALFAEASRGEADVIIIPADLRIDYATAWQLDEGEIDYTGKLGLGHEDSIFNELQVLGVTTPIYGDVMVLRAEEEPFNNDSFRAALLDAMEVLENDEHARAIWQGCGYTGFTLTSEYNYDNIREMAVFGAQNE
jgi:phosphonate transport system substrate-binding protein